MAHIEKRPDNKWLVVVEIGRDKNGKRKRKFKYCDSESEAEKELANMILHYQHKNPYEIEHLYFNNLIDDYMSNKSKLSQTTYNDYMRTYDKHIKPYFEDQLVADIKPYHIKRYINIKSMELADATVRRHYILINSVFKYAVTFGIIDKNPCLPVETPSEKSNKEVEILNEEEVQELLDLASGKYIYKIIFTAIHTGMRRGEIAALKWRNVDFRNKKIYITESATRIKDKGIIFKEPKTKSSKRGIDISEKLNDFLKEIKVEQEKQLRKTGYENNHDLVFCPVEHEILSPDFLTKRFYRLTKDTKFENITLHNLRHTHASILLKLGESMKVIQERLGHSSSKITSDIYSHLYPTMQKVAAEKIADYF